MATGTEKDLVHVPCATGSSTPSREKEANASFLER